MDSEQIEQIENDLDDVDRVLPALDDLDELAALCDRYPDRAVLRSCAEALAQHLG